MFVCVIGMVVLLVMYFVPMQGSKGKRAARFMVTMRPDATEASIMLTWDATTDPTVTGYKFFYGTASGVYTTMIPVPLTSHQISVSLGPGTYFFAVKATNALGVDSAYSNEVSAQVLPPPTATPGPTPAPSPTSPPTPVPTFVAAGRVISCTNGTGLSGVTVTVSGDATQAAFTDSTGNYSFNLNQGGSYTVTPTHANLPPASTGINTVDVVAIVRNYLLGDPLGCPGAGDVNGDGRINTVDILAVQRFTLGIPSAHVGEYTFAPVSAPAVAEQDFTATLTGDVQ
jgi:hypothetical protein